MALITGKLIVTMVNPEMFIKVDIDQSVITTPSIGMNHGIWRSMPTDNGLQCCFRTIRNNLRIHFTLDAVEIDFVIQMKHLTDAGYNVLAYDFRSHGRSSASNNSVSGIGQIEWRDCVGVKKYVDNHLRMSEMKVVLYSKYMGGNSQYEAINRHPGLFKNVSCLGSPMVVSMRAIYQAFSELQDVDQYLDLLYFELLKAGAFLMDEMTPQLSTHGVKMPVLMVQVKDDAWTKNPEDAQKTFELLGSKEKELLWIEGTTRRFKDGYNYFGRYPEKIIKFFDKNMK